MVLLPLLASCGVVHAASGEKHYREESPAMEPTIKRNTTVVAKAVKAGDYRPADGDIVVFRPSDGWGVGSDRSGNAGPSSNEVLIFRVTGIPGETVQCCGSGGQIKRNGSWVNEPYLSKSSESATFDPVNVPAGRIYVLADDRGFGADSSAVHDTVPIEAVIGIVKI